ncbi:MAG: hypothetical protein IKQ10_07970 [Oscillospiraceae bacterium]|nr:hypothetical protein [Oscillospiraceae bacterium]
MAETVKCLAVRVPGLPSDDQAEAIVRAALAPRDDWGALEIEIFPGREGTLLLARPARGVYITADALRFLVRRRR